jgi:hypothetical protein
MPPGRGEVGSHGFWVLFLVMAHAPPGATFALVHPAAPASPLDVMLPAPHLLLPFLINGLGIGPCNVVGGFNRGVGRAAEVLAPCQFTLD